MDQTYPHRRAAGKALRQQVPRSWHRVWQPPQHRPDPIELLEQSNQGRDLALIPLRYGRMLQSSFAFFRGSALIMATDLATTPTTGIMVQACGDCHLLNFGGFATPERNLVFDVNDFDETLPSAWEWDIKRLATSTILAGRGLNFSPKACIQAARSVTQAYRLELRRCSQQSPLDLWYAQLETDVLIAHAPDKALRQGWVDMTHRAFNQTLQQTVAELTAVVEGQRRLIDNPPRLYHPPNQAEYFEDIQTLFQHYRASLPVDCQVLLDRYRLVDVAINVVGVGSVGTHCGVALLLDKDDHPLLLQYKEARPSVLKPHTEPWPYPHEGERIVNGQRLMQAASDSLLGWATHPQGQSFYIRQLKDMKAAIKLATMSAKSLSSYAEICGSALARAHARTGDAALLRGYLGKGKAFDRAVTSFAVAYANQVEQDYQTLVQAVKLGRITAHLE